MVNEVIRPFLWGFVPSCNSAFLCLMTLVLRLSKEAANFFKLLLKQAQKIPLLLVTEKAREVCLQLSRMAFPVKSRWDCLGPLVKETQN